MPKIDKNIIKIPKLKKDGSLDSSRTNEIAAILKSGQTLILPIDAIYGIVSMDPSVIINLTNQFSHCQESDVELLVSSFKMVDHLVQLDKLEYDFLHRIWPGEITVLLDTIGNKNKITPMRIPRSKYILDVIDILDKQLYHLSLYHIHNKHVYKRDEIIHNYERFADKVVIITEFCKEHTAPSLIDIRNHILNIIEDGRVSSEEIKSLYFL